MANKFNDGDVVSLKTGDGPKLIVECTVTIPLVNPIGKLTVCKCVWWDEYAKSFQKVDLCPDSLVKIQ